MKTRTKTRTIPKTPFFAAFSVGAVLFSAHAGGGFATGNQANTYYVGLGWAGIVSAIVAMLLLTLTMREAMIMYNSRGLTSYKQLFETLYHPFDKIEWLFEIFFYIMVLMAVAAAISGAASALRSYFGVNYYLGVVAVGCLVLLLTIFGAGIVRAASTYMGIAILVTAITIYAIGIFKSESPLFTVLSADFQTTGSANVPKAIFNAFTYAGFQCVTLPTMIACGTTMRSKQGCAKAMWISFAMNAVALVLSVFMLICWRGVYTAVDGGTTIPTLTVCNAMGIRALTAVYGVCLMLCLISTGVTTIFGFVARFEKLPMFRGIQSAPVRSAIVSAFIIILSMSISMAGLTNIIKYGYGYWQDEFHAHMKKAFPVLKRGESALVTKRKRIPTWLFKQSVDLTRQQQAIEKAVSEIGVLNAGKKRDEILEMVGPYFSRLEKHLGQMKKYQATIDYLTQENEGLKEKVNSEKSIQKQMEVLTLKKKNERLRRFVDSIPPEVRRILREQQRQQRPKDHDL